jgi:hypothetical protein
VRVVAGAGAEAGAGAGAGEVGEALSASVMSEDEAGMVEEAEEEAEELEAELLEVEELLEAVVVVVAA